MDGELVLQEGRLCRELALQRNVVKARADLGLQVQTKTYINCSFTEEIDSLKY